MHEFLLHLDTPEVQDSYRALDEVWDRRAAQFNARMLSEGLPLAAAHLSSIWTLCFTRASRYNWMLQYYLRAEGLALSWVGTGRLIFSLNYGDAEFGAVLERFVSAARKMQEAGFWWTSAQLTDKTIRRTLFKEMLAHRF
jgi:glutamate-1-semialdehyde 2,1-aminomutase